MTSSIERERKFSGWAGFSLPDLSGVAPGVIGVPMPEQRLEATYYDTSDLRLARSGVSVRFRTGEGDGRWTVKLPAGTAEGSLVRREVEVRAPGRVIPAEVAAIVRGHVRGALLAPVGQLQTVRRRVELRDGDGAVAEVADDEVSVLEGRRVAVRFREIEVELKPGGDGALLDSVGERLRLAGAAPAEQIPKIVRALGPRALGRPDVVVDPLGGNAALGEVIQVAVSAAYVRILRHDPGARLGGDIEDVHQARVATRRLRSDLRTFRDFLDSERTDALRGELQWLGQELGIVRDNDVLLERIERQITTLLPADAAAAAGLTRRLVNEGTERRSALGHVLDSDRYLSLLDAIAAAATSPPFAAGVDVDEPARSVLPRVVKRPWRHLQRAVAALPDDPEEADLHEIRIRAKRARYAAEAAAPVFGKPATQLARALARLQGVLGELQDAVVAEEWLREAGRRGPAPQAFAAGMLVRVERDEKSAARRAWPLSWAELDSKKLRAWLA